LNPSAVSTRHYWLAYPTWIVLCAALFFSLGHIGNPARRSDRIDDDRATAIALAHLRRVEPVRFADYEVVHVTYARKGEASSDSRWLILCDARERSGMRDAVIVELSARDGSVIDLRQMDASQAAIGSPIVSGGRR
jgi:hypothetical protein